MTVPSIGDGVLVAVGVDRAAAAAAGRAGLGRVGAVAGGLVVGEGLSSTAQDTPMLHSAPPLEQHALPAEGAVDHVYRLVVVLAEHPDGGPAEVGPGGVAAVAGERGFTTLTRPPRTNIAPPPPPSKRLAGGVAVDEGQVLDVSCGVAWFWQCEVVQTWAGSQVSWYRMRRRPAAAQRDLAAAVEHDLGAGVAHLGRGRHARS